MDASRGVAADSSDIRRRRPTSTILKYTYAARWAPEVRAREPLRRLWLLAGLGASSGGFGAMAELELELQDELVDHTSDDGRRQIGEGHDRIEPVAEFRREHPLDRLLVLAIADSLMARVIAI